MVKIMNSENGVEISIFDNIDSPFTLDLYMRRFIGEKKRIQAFHAVLTTQQAQELITDLESKIAQCEARNICGDYAQYHKR